MVCWEVINDGEQKQNWLGEAVDFKTIGARKFSAGLKT